MRRFHARRDTRGDLDCVSLLRLLSCVLLLGASAGAAAAPDPFSFVDQSDVATGVPTVSNEITVSGVDGSTTIGISGGFYSVNDGAFTAADGSVANGSAVRVKVTSAPDANMSRNVRLMIGDASDVFTVTTGASDTSPIQFMFTDQTGVPPGSTRFAGPVMITGINAPTPISVIGGDYRVNEGAYTRAPGMVNAGDMVRLKQQSSFEPLTTLNTRLMVGSTVDIFSTTSNDTDVNPDPFEFELIRYQDRGAPAESMRMVPVGYDAPSPVKALAGTEYRIGGAAGPGVYTSAPGMIQPGESIQVRHNASVRYDALRTTALKIGKLTVYHRTRTSRKECDQSIAVDKSGTVLYPAEAFEIDPPEDVDVDQGLISTLYPTLDTTTDAFYPNLPCEPSIGGELPEEEELPTQDEIDAATYIDDFEGDGGQTILDDLAANPRAAVGTFPDFSTAECTVTTEGGAGSPGGTVTVPCDDPVFLNSAMPFEGRDIIFVHGLAVGHLEDRLKHPTGPAATKIWPQDASEFLDPGKYYRQYAEHYWLPHIIEHLSSTDPVSVNTSGWQWTPSDASPVYVSKANRYLIVAWSSNQTIEFAQHALLTQIQLAMTTGQNVVTPAGYPALQSRPFCANGCIVVGHSTAPLVTSSALGLAASGFYGPGGETIARSIVAHVAFDGAISGSRLATLAMAIAVGGPPTGAAVANLVCTELLDFFKVTCSTPGLGGLTSSILRDLMPPVSQAVWGPWVGASPVPTVTFAAGHPKGTGKVTGLLVPGVDDGVISMNSACGNDAGVFPYISPPSGFTPTSLVKAFEFSDVSDRLKRAARIFVNQRNLLAGPPYPGVAPLTYLAGTCTPWLSASGMVMPVQNAFPGHVSFDTRKRYPNHYSFMIGIGEHSYDGGNGEPPNEWPSGYGLPPSALRYYMPFPDPPDDATWFNREESVTVTDNSIYTRLLDANGTHLVKPVPVHQIVRGRKVKFHMPFNIGQCTKQAVAKWYCTRWIWKRTYHLADKWEQKQSSHYAYEFVGRR